MAKRRAIQFSGAMPEEIAIAKRRPSSRRSPLRADGALAVAVVISLLLVVPPALLGWRVGQSEGYGGIVLAVLAGSVLSVLLTFLASRAWQRFAPGDRTFADATVSGWLRRARGEREAARARKLFADPNVAAIDLHVDRLTAIARALEARDSRTHKHSSRVAMRAAAIAHELDLGPDEIQRVRVAAKLHDIGTLRTPLFVGATHEDRVAVAIAGGELLEFTGDRELVKAIRHQQERFDGSGAPSALAGAEIPLVSRILAVAEAYDLAATSSGQAAALKLLREGSGEAFDPHVVDAFNASTLASPTAAIRGALSAAFPRAAQGVGELLRGTASVAAAASIATTAVVAGGAAVEREVQNSKGAGALATATQTVTDQTAADREDRNQRSADDRNAKKDSTSTGADGNQQTADDQTAAENKDGGKNHGGNSDPGSRGSGSGTQSGADAAPGAVDQVTGTLDKTVSDTTNTLSTTVGGVGETLDSTTGVLGDTVGGVVGGLTGN